MHEVFNQAVVSLNSLMTKEVKWKVQNPVRKTVLIRTTVDNALQTYSFSTDTTGLSPPSLPTTVIGLLDHKEWPVQVLHHFTHNLASFRDKERLGHTLDHKIDA